MNTTQRINIPGNKMFDKMQLVSIFVIIYLLLGTKITGQENGHLQHKNQISFKLAIEQNGENKEINNNTCKLDKLPFTIVISLSEPGNVLINASFKPLSFQLAKNGIDINNIPCFEETGMAEFMVGNPDKEILVKNTAPSCWYYTDSLKHRFDEVTVLSNGEICCKREINSIHVVNDRKNIPIQEIENDLYLVLCTYKWAEDYSKKYEIQRGYLKLEFKRP
jgi:hypothetical protein